MKEKQRLQHTRRRRHTKECIRGGRVHTEEILHTERTTHSGNRCGEGGVHMVECTHGRVYTQEED